MGSRGAGSRTATDDPVRASRSETNAPTEPWPTTSQRSAVTAPLLLLTELLEADRRAGDPHHHVLDADRLRVEIGDHAATEQHDDAVADLVHLGDVVADEQHRRPAAA